MNISVGLFEFSSGVKVNNVKRMMSVVMMIMFFWWLNVFVSRLVMGIIMLKLIIVIISIYSILLCGKLSFIGVVVVL